MSRAYSVVMSDQTIIASATVASVRTTVDNSIEVLRAWVGQTNNATSAQEGIQLATQATAFSTLTSTAPVPLDQGGPASGIAGGTAQAVGTSGTDSSAEGGGAVVVLMQDAFNVLNGWLWVPTPKEVVVMPASIALAFVVKFTTTADNLANWSAGLNFNEM